MRKPRTRLTKNEIRRQRFRLKNAARDLVRILRETLDTRDRLYKAYDVPKDHELVLVWSPAPD